MARTTSIYVSPPINEAIRRLGKQGTNVSGRLATVCERYLEIVADELARIKMTKAEWCAIMDANNGVQIMTGNPFAHLIWANVFDSPELEEKWGVDVVALANKLQALPKSTLLAIREAIDIFWSHANAPTDDALKAAGVTPCSMATAA